MSSTCSKKPYSIVSHTRTSLFLFRPSEIVHTGNRKDIKPSRPRLLTASLLLTKAKGLPSSIHLSSSISNNHLRNTLPTQRLTRRKLLLLQPRERLESRSNKQHNRSRNKTRRVADQREELDDAHGEVDGGAHVVCLEAADESVEVLGGRADAEEEGDFDED